MNGWLRTCCLIALVVAAPATMAQETQVDQPRTLAPSVPIERDLIPGQTHSYELHLDAQQFFHAEVAPDGINVAARLFYPDGKLFMGFDYGDMATAETIMFVAKTTGRYELQVVAPKDVPAGRYVVRIEALRPATSVDVRRVAAMRKLEEGNRTRPTLEPSAWGQLDEPYEAALAGFRELGDREGEAKTLYELAFTAEALGRPEGFDRAREALVLYSELGDQNGRAKSMYLIGNLHDRAGEMPKALDTYLQALALTQQAGNVVWEATVRNALGIIYGKTSDAERAMAHFAEALSVARTMKARRVEISTLNNLGISAKNLGDYRLALDYYEQALLTVRSVGDRTFEANVLNNLGTLYRLLGDRERALTIHGEALTLSRQVKNAEHEARALNNLGSTHYRLGNFRKALEYHEQSLAIRRQLKDLVGQASALDAAGRAWHRLGDSEKAVEYLSEALRFCRAVGDRLLESDTLRDLALVERNRGNLNAALDSITASVELTDSLRGRVISPDLRATFVASEQEQYELQIDVLMQLHRERPGEGFDRRALEASEHGRARVLLESLLEARADIRQGVDAGLLERERTLQRQIDAASARLSRGLSRQSGATELDAARDQIETLSAENRQLRVRIRQESPAYAALTQPSAISPNEIQRDLVDPDTLLLEYALGEKRSWLWMVTPTVVANFELPPRHEIEAVAREVYGLLTARLPRQNEPAAAGSARVAKSDAELRQQSSVLGRMLLGPAAAHLGPAWAGKRVLVVASDVLQYIPFAALTDPAKPGQPLVADHEIVSLPSASVLAVIRQQTEGRAQPAKGLAVLADPVFDERDPRIAAASRTPAARERTDASARRDMEAPAVTLLARAIRSADAMSETPPARLSRLPFSRREARAISDLIPAAQRLEAVDFQANRATATSGELGAYRLVHFATHGFLNSEQPELSGLVLSLVDREGNAQDGFLRLNDIYNLRLPAEVVVLSACQTALGKEIRGEGLVGLTRGFMYAGARRVVASLWQVDDLATAELMRLFYRGMLKDGLRPATALRAAQRQLAREPRWASPFFWSGFVLQGEWR